jgi:transcriptional regulator with XRE-family HTH domain
MSKVMFNFTKEMAKILRRLRENANLTQKEVATRMGIKTKYGQSLIAQIEMGKVKNPSLRTILDYLRACGSSWPEFFKQLDTIDFKLRHEKMISQLPPPASQRKIQRDAMRYEIGVEFPSKEKEEIDFERLRKQFGNRVLVLLSKNQVAEKDIPSYQKFSLEYFDFLATLNKAGMKIVTDKYHRAGLKLNLLLKIKKIINSVLMGEIKRIESKKPLPTVKQEKMAIGFTKYRIKIEQIEAEVHKVLCELGVQPPWFALYKYFARECYRALKRYYGKEILSQKLSEIIRRWIKEGLKEEVLLKVKDATIKVVEGK